MADALVKGADAGSLDGLMCPVGGAETMGKVADLLGMAIANSEPMVAVVRCNGTCEHRAKIAKANSGKKRSDATRKKMSKSWEGHEVTDETKAKLSANSPLKRPVRCIETNEIFDSITAASK